MHSRFKALRIFPNFWDLLIFLVRGPNILGLETSRPSDSKILGHYYFKTSKFQDFETKKNNQCHGTMHWPTELSVWPTFGRTFCQCLVILVSPKEYHNLASSVAQFFNHFCHKCSNFHDTHWINIYNCIHDPMSIMIHIGSTKMIINVNLA